MPDSSLLNGAGDYPYAEYSSSERRLASEPKTDLYRPQPEAKEVISKRTANTKYYVDRDTVNKFYYVQSIDNIHFMKNGRWETIDQRLFSMGEGVYEAYMQPEPVGFDEQNKCAYIKTAAGTVRFNQWQLKSDINGREYLLADPDWSNLTAYEDMVLIEDIFPGIDAEMHTTQAGIKTNFIIRQNKFPQAKSFIFSDSYDGNDNSYILIDKSYTSARFVSDGKDVLKIGTPLAYVQEAYEQTVTWLHYSVNNTKVSLTLDADYINASLQKGPVVVDPLVKSSASTDASNMNGYRNCGTPSGRCRTEMTVMTPEKSTITGVYLSYRGISTVPRKYYSMCIGVYLDEEYKKVISDNHDDFSLTFGADPKYPLSYNSAGGIGMNMTELEEFPTKMPIPTCEPRPVVFYTDFFNSYCPVALTDTACSQQFISHDRPWSIVLEGKTVESYVWASDTICLNDVNAMMQGYGKFGVSPYKYDWFCDVTDTAMLLPDTAKTYKRRFSKWDMPTSEFISTTIAPQESAKYTFVVTDLCGETDTSTAEVYVRQVIAPDQVTITTNSPVCEGETLTLSAPTFPNMTYYWGGPLKRSQSQDFTIANVKHGDAGTYRLRLVNEDNCNSPLMDVEVEVLNSEPSISIVSSLDDYCPNGIVKFRAVAKDGGSTPSFQWIVNGRSVGADQAVFSSAALNDGDRVNCVLTSSAGGCLNGKTAVSNGIIFYAPSNNLVSDIDGNSYKTVKIGEQMWMQENLRTSTLKDGTPILDADRSVDWNTVSVPASCVYDLNKVFEERYGRYYNSLAVKTGKLCPEGWHVPSETDWNILEAYLIHNNYSVSNKPDDSTAITKSLASQGRWFYFPDYRDDAAETAYKKTVYPAADPATNNSSGFNGIPAGCRFSGGRFLSRYETASWWSSGEDEKGNVYNRSVSGTLKNLWKQKGSPGMGYNVRCVRNDDYKPTFPINLQADDQQICQGQSTFLQLDVCGGTAPYTYQWDDASLSSDRIEVSPVADSVFYVTVTDSDGAVATDSVSISVIGTFVEISDVACNQYDFNGKPLTQTGVYYDTLINSAGCDSVVKLNFKMANPTDSLVTATVCGNSYILNGITYNQSGSYVQTIQNADGCDSIIRLDLQLQGNILVEEHVYEQSCGDYGFMDSVYSVTGVYEHQLQTVGGCDSLVKLHLTVVHPTDSVITATICGDKYTLNSITYDQSGSYEQTLQNATGCDSTIKLNLQLEGNSPVVEEINEQSCGDYGFMDSVYSVTGVYEHQLQTVGGCDSLVKLHLTVVHPTDSVITATICGDKYTLNGITYDRSGSYEQTLQNAAGCDSTIKLNLQLEGNSPVVEEINEQSCGDFRFMDSVYKVTGVYEHQLQTVGGCDSLVKLHLTVVHPTDSVITAMVCGDKYTLNGITYDQSGSYEQTVQNAAGCDSTIKLDLQLEGNSPVVEEINEHSCGDFRFMDSVYSVSGVYEHQLQTAGGCDSLVKLHLTVGHPTDSVITAMVCGDKYTLNGITYDQSGSYEQTVQNVAGCDSTIKLDLQFEGNSPVVEEINEHSCGDFRFMDSVYSVSGVYEHQLQSVGGCDSLVKLHLTVGHPTDSVITAMVCGDKYTLNGITYDQSGSYEQTVQNATGCDSTIKLDLQFEGNSPVVEEINEHSCGDFRFMDSVYSVSGVYEHQLQSVGGCDSLVKLHLTVGHPTDSVITATICGNSYILNGITYDQSGRYEQTVQNATGCDSTIKLNLQLEGNSPVVEEINEHSCGDFHFMDSVYSVTGVYEHQLQTAGGCDSLVKLHLTVGHPTDSVITATICGDNYTLNGITYDQSGRYEQTVPNVAGCDSTIRLNLQILDNLPIVNEVHHVSCGSYKFKNIDCDTSGLYEHTFQTAGGCDSIVRLYLTVLQPPILHNYDSISQDDMLLFKGRAYSETGVYRVLLNSESGCDTTVYLHLEVLPRTIEEQSSLFVPNAFAPMGTPELTRLFKPVGMLLESYKIWVYDSWGNTVWYSNELNSYGSPATGWDGTYKGKLMHPGVYVWKIEAVYSDGSGFNKFGDVILLK